MQQAASIVARARHVVAWNVHTIRWVYLFVGLIFILVSRSPALEAITAPPPSTLTPQLQLFATNCQSRCDRLGPFDCSVEGCPVLCNTTQSPYYRQIWPTLSAVCDAQCQTAMPGLCAGSTTCADICLGQVRALLQRPTSAALPLFASIHVLPSLGPTFWSTLVLIPLAAADVLVSLIKLGPHLRATDEEIYNNSYSFVNKLVAVLDAPAHFFTAATIAFEVKCLVFDDSDGYGLSITVVLHLISLIVHAIPSAVTRLRQGHRRDVQQMQPDEGQCAAPMPRATPIAVSASPRLSIPSRPTTTPLAMGQSI